MDIVSMLKPQARARRNARRSMQDMQIRREQTEEADRAVVAEADRCAALIVERQSGSQD